MENGMEFIPKSVVIAILVQLIAQLIKMIVHSIKDRKFRMKYFFSYGGMPSAHTAFVVALVVSIGFGSGIQSDVFAVALVFAIITMYDAVKLRGAVQGHAKVLNRLIGLLPEASRSEFSKQNEMIGHSTLEIVVGVLYALLVSIALNLVFS
jgi:acid phosphatase family membrane protein YuiD